MNTHPEGLREVIDASVERWADLYPTPDVVTHIADDVAAWLAQHDAKARAEERERIATALREKFGVTNRAASWIEREAGLK